MNIVDAEWNMTLALEEAETAFRADEVPVGAVIVAADGQILARAHNMKEHTNDPCDHAEISAIRKATAELGSWRLAGATLVVTLEPCPMCLAAMVQARISCLVFGAYDPKGGSLSLGYNMYKDERLNHRFSVMGGVRHYESGRLLSQFFREKRKAYKHLNS